MYGKHIRRAVPKTNNLLKNKKRYYGVSTERRVTDGVVFKKIEKQRLLFNAGRKNDPAGMEELLKEGADIISRRHNRRSSDCSRSLSSLINVRNKDGLTLPMELAYCLTPEVLECFIRNGGDTAARDEYGAQALMHFALRNHATSSPVNGEGRRFGEFFRNSMDILTLSIPPQDKIWGGIFACAAPFGQSLPCDLGLQESRVPILISALRCAALKDREAVFAFASGFLGNGKLWQWEQEGIPGAGELLNILLTSRMAEELGAGAPGEGGCQVL